MQGHPRRCPAALVSQILTRIAADVHLHAKLVRHLGQAGVGQARMGQAGAGQAGAGQAGVGQAEVGQAGVGQAMIHMIIRKLYIMIMIRNVLD